MIRFPARWSELATSDFADPRIAGAVAILPVGATEQHGPHLPLGTDAIISQGIVDRALTLLPADTPAIVLPNQEIGTSQEHLAFTGTLSLGARTLIGLWTEIAEGVHRSGVRRLLIFNSHGGQSGVPELIGADLRARLGMIVAWASPGAFGVPDGTVDPHEAAHGLHGGLKETAMLLHLRPDLVRLDAIANFLSEGARIAETYRQLRASGRVGFGWQAQDLNPAGVVGDASKATAVLGARFVVHAAEGLAALICDLVRFELPKPA